MKIHQSPVIAFVCFFLLFQNFGNAQPFGDLLIKKGVKKVDIPFEYENNFIIVKVTFNDVFPLKFIFDTGAEHTILTRREITDLLQINYDRQFKIKGADLSTNLYAYLARGVKLTIHNMIAENRSILVLEEDYFRFEEFGGINVQGIIGADLFRRYVVKIDYRRKVITIYDPHHFKQPDSHFQEIPVEFHRNKPYLFAGTIFAKDTIPQAKYLMDTGASIALLLYTNGQPKVELPPQFITTKIGMGLGGYLEGFLGRTEKLEIGNFPLEDVITNFQEIPPDADTTYLNGRNGIIGNQILNRFTMIVDYINGKVYFKPEKKFRQKFQYDKSGIILAASGINLNIFTVVDIIKGSPAEKAGILIGDEIKKVNGIPTILLRLESILQRFRGKSGKKVHLLIERSSAKIKKQIVLQDLI